MEKSKLLELQNKNQQLYRRLKDSKANKIDKLLDVVSETLLKENKSTGKEDLILDHRVEKALDHLAEDSDVEIIPNKKIKIKSEMKEEDYDACETTNNSNKGSLLASPSSSSHRVQAPGPNVTAGSVNHMHKVHEFIDELTINESLKVEDKENITLAFYDYELSTDVIPYFQSLLGTRKSFNQIAESLLWFIKVLKKRNQEASNETL